MHRRIHSGAKSFIGPSLIHGRMFELSFYRRIQTGYKPVAYILNTIIFCIHCKAHKCTYDYVGLQKLRGIVIFVSAAAVLDLGPHRPGLFQIFNYFTSSRLVQIDGSVGRIR